MGFVYHAHYLVWCDIGRTELLRALGLSYAQLEREGTLLAVTDAALRYQRAARYDDLVRISTTLRSVRSRSVSFEYVIERLTPASPAERLASATTTLTALDREGRLRTLPAELKDALADAR